MKQKTIMMILIPVILLIFIIIAYVKIINNINITEDSIKFKEEYENLNDNDTNEKYISLDISESNLIKYSDYDEIIDIIKNKTGIIYLGFPECIPCRVSIPVLLDSAKDNKIDKIYYLNIKDERDFYIVEDGMLVYNIDESGKEQKGTDGYFKLLDVLNDYLTDYIVSFDGITYETGEKRIYTPSVIFVNKGKVLGIHVSTNETKLTNDEYKELYNIYSNYMKEMNNTH